VAIGAHDEVEAVVVEVEAELLQFEDRIPR
jgi:hypothetical protein